MTASTTDKRIDELSDHLDQRFEEQALHTDQRFEQQARHTDQRFEEQARQTDQRFDRVEADVRDLRSEVRVGFQRSGADIHELRGELHEEVKGLRTEMNNGFAALDAKFDAKFDSLNKTIIWLLGGSLSVATAGILAAVFHVIS